MQQAEYDVLQLVKQVGGLVVKDYVELTYKEIESFAKLVTAKERDECAKICENFADIDSGPDGIEQDYHAKLIRARGETTSRGEAQ